MNFTGVRYTFYALAIFGLYGTWGRALLNGSLEQIFKILHGGGILPGTQDIRLLNNLTGIYWPIDYTLSLLVTFFWQAVDGSHPSTTAFALYFGAQHLAVFVYLHANEHRRGEEKGTHFR
jgi:hypothetical protein